MTASKTAQWTATQHRDNLRLIPPLSEDFRIYGGGDVIERARKWALRNRFLLADGIPACAHGLYLMASCPKNGCTSEFRQLDHARIWICTIGMGRAFVLSHPYSLEINADTRTYAKAHGLDLMVSRSDDGYGSGTLPITMTLPDNWPLWPIEATITVLLRTQPVAWPDDPDGPR